MVTETPAGTGNRHLIRGRLPVRPLLRVAGTRAPLIQIRAMICGHHIEESARTLTQDGAQVVDDIRQVKTDQPKVKDETKGGAKAGGQAIAGASKC